MFTIKNVFSRSNPLKVLLALTIVFLMALFFVGCGVKSAAPQTDPDAVVAEAPAEQTPPPIDNLIKQFGDVVTYEDGLSVSVSDPSDFAPTEYAAGNDQTYNIVLGFTVTNGTNEVIDPFFGVSVSSGGVEASQIFDMDNPAGDINFSPDTSVLPGQTVSWNLAFSISDPEAITVDFSPGFEWESAVFTNIPF